MCIMTHKEGRHEKMYVRDNPDLKVHKLDCVPSNRPKGSWTNGVKAWKRPDEGGGSDTCVGWFFPPRTRNKNHHRWSPSVRRMVPRKPRVVGTVHQEEE